MRILIVRLSAMGDIIHTLPLARNAHRAGIEVGWLVETSYAPLLAENPSITRLFVAQTRRWRWKPLLPLTHRALRGLARELKQFRPDFTIEAHGLWKSAVLARMAGAPVVGLRRRDRREPGSALLIDRPVALAPEAVHVVDQNLLLLSELGIPVVERAPDARYLLARESPQAEAFLATLARPFALYHPGTARKEKAWGEERYARLARLLQDSRGLTPVISWGPGDEARRDRMAAMLARGITLPPLDYAGLARVIESAAIFIAGDTGPAHLADAMGCRTLALFGPASAPRNVPERNHPYRGWAMRYDDAVAVESVATKAIEMLDRPGQP